MEYIDLHAHMVSRTTDDYRAMAMSGCVAVTEPAFWAGYDRPGGRRLPRLLRPPDRLRAQARSHLRHRPLHVDVPESQGGGGPRADSSGARDHPRVPGAAERPRDRRDRPQPRHAQRARRLQGSRRPRDGARPADPHPHAPPGGQVEGHEGDRRDARRRQPDHAAPRDGRPRGGAHGRHDPRQRVLDRPDALPGHEGHARPRDRHDRDPWPGADLRGGGVRLGREPAAGGPGVHPRDAPARAPGLADPQGRVRQPDRVPEPVRRSSTCPTARAPWRSDGGRRRPASHVLHEHPPGQRLGGRAGEPARARAGVEGAAVAGRAVRDRAAAVGRRERGAAGGPQAGAVPRVAATARGCTCSR